MITGNSWLGRDRKQGGELETPRCHMGQNGGETEGDEGDERQVSEYYIWLRFSYLPYLHRQKR